MDADYRGILDRDGKRIDQGEWQNSFPPNPVTSYAS